MAQMLHSGRLALRLLAAAVEFHLRKYFA